MEKAIEIKNLSKIYKDVRAVDGLSLTVKKGELFGLLGVNGAGKTTLVKMLSCLVLPTSGDAFVLGSSIITETDKVKQKIGISPQETAVAKKLTVEENLDLMAGAHGFDKEKRAKKAEEMIAEFGLETVRKKAAEKLSGGWQRKLSIAMALVSEPDVLFLDEPTLGLDVFARRELWKVIEELKGKVTIVLTTHYMEEAENLSDRICVMKNGKIIDIGTAKELMQKTNTDKFEDAFIKIVEECK
ncbi:MAG: ABC transporter ATP-binding protein [Candidatus Borkfalkiaceae bacterium]|nr:ABC transporter ATP-binding protein [Christensenellaceae bacterium]